MSKFVLSSKKWDRICLRQFGNYGLRIINLFFLERFFFNYYFCKQSLFQALFVALLLFRHIIYFFLFVIFGEFSNFFVLFDLDVYFMSRILKVRFFLGLINFFQEFILLISSKIPGYSQIKLNFRLLLLICTFSSYTSYQLDLPFLCVLFFASIGTKTSPICSLNKSGTQT